MMHISNTSAIQVNPQMHISSVHPVFRERSCNRTWHTKAWHSFTTAANAGSDVHHACLLAFGTVGWLLLTPVGKVGLCPAAETLAGSGAHIHHVISLAPALQMRVEAKPCTGSCSNLQYYQPCTCMVRQL